jgi:uracil-DNA glycosylase family 4
MSGDPADIKNLVRRALKAQIELGTEEAVLSRKARIESKKLPAVTIVRPAELVAAPESLFGAEAPTRGLKSPLGAATYGSIENHCDTIKTCMKCPLGATRNKFVYGVGNPNARLMFIGEAPGAQEDAQGEPFVGAAGQLLDKIMAAIQLSRKDVFIANILKCRPPNNRDPQPAEMDECVPYLLEQIRIIKPKLLCALGRVASQALLQTTTPLSRLRSQWHDFHGVPMLVTYHPAALLRFPANKKECWEDMKLLRARYDELG